MAKKVRVTDLKELNIAESEPAEKNDDMFLFIEIASQTPGTSKLVIPSDQKVNVNGAGKFTAKFKVKTNHNFGTAIFGISDKLGFVEFEI